MNGDGGSDARVVRAMLPGRVIECFVAVETIAGADVRIGACVLGYDRGNRVLDVRRTLLVRNTGGRVELAVLRVALWSRRLWAPAEHLVVHLAGEYVTRRVEAGLDELRRFPKIGAAGSEVEGARLEFTCGFEADRTDRPATPRMEEAAALAKSGRVSVELDCEAPLA